MKVIQLYASFCKKVACNCTDGPLSKPNKGREEGQGGEEEGRGWGREEREVPIGGDIAEMKCIWHSTAS